MERKRYLELCQKYAVYKEAVFVKYKGCLFYPVSYVLSFDEKGTSVHRCVLKDTKANSDAWALLERVEEYEK
jgi:hypothetical protein